MPRFSVAFSKRKPAADVVENVPVTNSEAPSFRVIERSEIQNGRSFDGGARLARASKSFPIKTNHLVDFEQEDNMFADLKVNRYVFFLILFSPPISHPLPVEHIPGGTHLLSAFPCHKSVHCQAFADLAPSANDYSSRGSNISNTTKGTSTDTSSRHSNASTAPSSADMGGSNGYDDNRPPPKSAPQEGPSRNGSKSIGSGLLDRATRTFSFGGQKKHSIPPPKQDPIPDLPPVLSLGGENPGAGISRGMTASTASTATPTNTTTGSSDTAPGGGGGGALDLGGDFGSMFKSFDKRASTATLTLANQDLAAPRSLTGNRYGPPGPISPDTMTPTEPLLNQRHSPTYSDDTPTSPASVQDDVPPPVPRHEHLNSFKYSSRPSDVVEDEDAKLLRDSFKAMKFLSDPKDKPQGHSSRPRYGEDSFTAVPSKPIASNFEKEENMFEGSLSRVNRVSHRYAPRSSNPPRNKVMTPAQFEKYRQDKEGLGTAQQLNNNIKPTAKVEDDEDDEINYDDDEDEQEKSKQQTRQRRKQEAHMAVYRQQMMKVTGETNAAPLPTRQPVRPGMVPSSSAPTLSHLKAPSPDPAATTGTSSEEDDEDVPLAILQAHGFPTKNRPPTRLSTSGSNPNLRASVVGMPGVRAPSAMGGDSASMSGRRHSTLPAFARNLPQDPFVGASIARPAIRESLTFGGDARQPSPQPPQAGPLPPGGLVGVIANEERSRAMRRGSPSIDHNKLIGGAMNAGNGNVGYDPFAAMPPHMMYQQGGGMPGMHGMPQMHQMPQPPMLTPGDQAQIQMTHQMQQFMQMQMQFMQMMAGNPNGGGAPQMQQQQPPMQPSYGGHMPGNQSMGDLSRHSLMIDPMMEPRRMDHGMRTMSMVQPSSASFMAPGGRQGPPSIRGSGGHGTYSPSIAPSERSNVGLPGRYRPVSQAPAAAAPLPGQHVRSNTMSGGLSLSNWSDDKSKSTVKLMANSRDGSDDDDEQGWEAMKTKREKKRSIWRTKRNTANELNIAF
ncbi:hypothetical protein VFPPC_00699 [Pochonia chlamydosporia 170]|uniref:Uncharacterized protein n=1 Tax=Pochonia chlamydosporia 170 TaxID=1380566 RepID=A0A179G4P9_METCM|nr:hypothetical protein VFPPC_00699 [Pochonia chlamydosporia 170]OAQ72834.1 hypothetical protein VFPPC_00699 [Pochonia chlamydosporia 170]